MAAKTILVPSEWIRKFQSSPPVNVKKMAEELGLRIFDFDKMPSGASGMLYPDKESPEGWSIGVSSADSPTRKRFSIAHEIAHYLLHRNYIGSGVIDDTFYRSEHLSSAQETEANKFAADILMPYGLIEDMAKNGTVNVDDLARRFGVSLQAMKIRLGIPLP